MATNYHILIRTGGVYEGFTGSIDSAQEECSARNNTDEGGSTEVLASFSSEDEMTSQLYYLEAGGDEAQSLDTEASTKGRGLFRLVEVFTMAGGGEAARFMSRDGREMRVDFFDRTRLKEHGLEANVEVYGIGHGWETPKGRTIRPRLWKYMVLAILAAGRTA